jgi:antibiotic biosynthesis monooxygenase (ABM) superfamily enzyme
MEGFRHWVRKLSERPGKIRLREFFLKIYWVQMLFPLFLQPQMGNMALQKAVLFTILLSSVG